MSAVSPPLDASAGQSPPEESRYQALCRLIRRGHGDFFLILIEYDLPRTRNEFIRKLTSMLPDLRLEVVHLTRRAGDTGRVLDLIEEHIRVDGERAPDALILVGYESFFPQDANPEDASFQDTLISALQPLNLGRNILAEKYPYPFFLCLPSREMTMLQQFAPDLSSWRSQYLRFTSDHGRVMAELEEAAAERPGWRFRRKWAARPPAVLLAEIRRTQELLDDAEALPRDPAVGAGKMVAQASACDPPLILRLYQRLGWLSIALRDRPRADAAFAAMRSLAAETHDEAALHAAERGHRAIQHLTVKTGAISADAAEAQRVFLSIAPVASREGLFGRDEELRQLVGRIRSPARRFLIVYGRTGSGKSSLVLAGLAPELKGLGFLPIVIRQWDNPIASIRVAIENAFGSPMDPRAALRDSIDALAKKTGRTVAIVCDQFEQFFAAGSKAIDREPALKAIGDCVNDLRVDCRFVFVIRDDYLSRMAEFDAEIADPLAKTNRFFVPPFGAARAAEILRQAAAEQSSPARQILRQTVAEQLSPARRSSPARQGGVAPTEAPHLSPAFTEHVIADLAEDGFVSPIRLRLTAEALANSGIADELSYDQAGRSQGLLADYLDRTLLAAAEAPAFFPRPLVSQRDLQRVMLALISGSERLTLDAEQIQSKTGIRPEMLNRALKILTARNLVRRVGEQNPRYELTHDILVSLLEIGTTRLYAQTAEANRILRRALETLRLHPNHTIGWLDARRVRKYADSELLAHSEARALLRRSRAWAIAKAAVLFAALVSLVMVDTFFGFASVEHYVLNDRVVIQRGLPQLQWLFSPRLQWLFPSTQRIILDTGLHAENFARDVDGMTRWYWGTANLKSEFLEDPGFKSAVAAGYKPSFLCQIEDRACSNLLDGIRRGDEAAIRNYENAAVVDPGLAQAGFDAVLAGVIAERGNPDLFYRRALVRAVRTQPQLWEEAVRRLETAHLASSTARQTLAELLWVRVMSETAREQDRQVMHQAAAGLVPVLLDWYSSGHRQEFVYCAGYVGAADPDAAARLIPLLLKILGEHSGLSDIVADQLGRIAWGQPATADRLVAPLAEAARVLGDLRFALALGMVLQHRPDLAGRVAEAARADGWDEASRTFVLVQAGKADPKQWPKALEAVDSLPTHGDIVFENGEILVDAARAFPEIASKVVERLRPSYTGIEAGELTRMLIGAAAVQPGTAHSLLDPYLDEIDRLEWNDRYVREPMAFGPLLLQYFGGEDSPNAGEALLRQLDGAETLLKNGNANTIAPYRELVSGALAAWLASDAAETASARATLRERLRTMHETDSRLHLRVAAWKILVQEADIRETRAEHFFSYSP